VSGQAMTGLSRNVGRVLDHKKNHPSFGINM